MSTPLRSPDEITPEWLTAVLLAAGYLSQGRVVAVHAVVVETPASEARRLILEYSDDAPDDLPRQVFIKFSDRHSELDFFQTVAPDTKDINMLPPLAAEFWPEQNMGFLLFLDIADQYISGEGNEDLSEEVVFDQIIAPLTRLHAQWWDHPKLAGEIGAVAQDVFSFVFGVAQEAFDEFAVAANLSGEQIAFYQRLLAGWPFPALAERLRSGWHLTVVHGDVHFGNILFPHDPSANQILLIDWAAWHINMGANDLAYLVAFGPPEWRLFHEARLVALYYKLLCEQGVTGYSWAQCWQDYRMAALAQMLWPVFWWAYDIPEEIWRETLTNSWATYRELGLGDLLP